MNSRLFSLLIATMWLAFATSFLPGCAHRPAPGRYVFVAGTPEAAESEAYRQTGRTVEAFPDGDTWRAEVIVETR